ncbi:hypothetical protein FCL40_16385 [Ferrimonas sediminicola]|uniref:DUF4878 domain-containing protein n=1 Tax=Ferrimonas sediminicola TaxID=2569538 RepID=A0A4U1BAV2_9GAMM|nr:hypothetical protein [Ferrimonas sediminicola]TKB47279.1 hypothetical protein FCL40_16385 [Ferrimonas sediminicola]
MIRIALLLLLPILGGCTPAAGPDLPPEKVAVKFFEAIYVDRDVGKALPMVDDGLKDLFQHYKLASQVQRNLFGLYMEQAEVELSSTNADFFRRRNYDILVTIKLKGLVRGYMRQDLREIRLQRLQDRWMVTEIKEDRWLTNG